MKHTSSDSQPTILFEVQLRLGSEIIPVRVLNSDDHSSLTDRVCQDHRIDAHYRQLIQSKILEALHKIVKGGNVEQPLLRKVQRFMGRETQLKQKLQEVEEAPSGNSNNSSMLYSNNEEHGNPYESYVNKRQKQLFGKQQSDRDSQGSCSSSRSNANTSQINSNKETQQNTLDAYIPSFGIKERKFGGDLNNSQTNNAQFEGSSLQKRETKLSPTPNKNDSNVNRSTTGQVRTHEDCSEEKLLDDIVVKNRPQWKATGTPSQFDIDLLQAYKNVYEKCRNPPMKEMVKRIIEQLECKHKRATVPRYLKTVNVQPFNESQNEEYTHNTGSINSSIGYLKEAEPKRNNPINLFSFQELELDRHEKKSGKHDKQEYDNVGKRQAAITLLNKPYLEDISKPTLMAKLSEGQNIASVMDQPRPTSKVDMNSLDNLLNRNKKLLEQTSPNNRRNIIAHIIEQHSPQKISKPKSIMNPKNTSSTSKSPRRVQFAEERKQVFLLSPGSPSKISNKMTEEKNPSPTRYFTRCSPEKRPYLQSIDRYVSARQPSTFSLQRVAKPTESLPISTKNSAIKPSSVTCIHANPNNSRRYKYLQESDYCM